MKIGIVGAGQVGATAAYSMMMRRVGSGILLVDRNADLAVAQARDILDATPFADPVRVRAGDWAHLDGARLVVLAAGTNQRPGESRLDLLSRNAEIFAEIVPVVLAATSMVPEPAPPDGPSIIVRAAGMVRLAVVNNPPPLITSGAFVVVAPS